MLFFHNPIFNASYRPNLLICGKHSVSVSEFVEHWCNLGQWQYYYRAANEKLLGQTFKFRYFTTCLSFSVHRGGVREYGHQHLPHAWLLQGGRALVAPGGHAMVEMPGGMPWLLWGACVVKKLQGGLLAMVHWPLAGGAVHGIWRDTGDTVFSIRERAVDASATGMHSCNCRCICYCPQR